MVSSPNALTVTAGCACQPWQNRQTHLAGVRHDLPVFAVALDEAQDTTDADTAPINAREHAVRRGEEPPPFHQAVTDHVDQDLRRRCGEEIRAPVSSSLSTNWRVGVERAHTLLFGVVPDEKQPREKEPYHGEHEDMDLN